MKEMNKEFYAHIGQLSIQFAKMEYKLSTIISKLISQEDELITLTLIEDNTLHKNLILLADLNRIRDVYAETIFKLIKEIEDIKKARNLFIHGIWDEPHQTEGGIAMITCEERRLKRIVEKDKKGKVTSIHWSYSRHNFYELNDFKKYIKTINRIIKIEDALIKALDEEKSV